MVCELNLKEAVTKKLCEKHAFVLQLQILDIHPRETLTYVHHELNTRIFT